MGLKKRKGPFFQGQGSCHGGSCPKSQKKRYLERKEIYFQDRIENATEMPSPIYSSGSLNT